MWYSFFRYFLHVTFIFQIPIGCRFSKESITCGGNATVRSTVRTVAIASGSILVRSTNRTAHELALDNTSKHRLYQCREFGDFLPANIASLCYREVRPVLVAVAWIPTPN